MTDSARLETAAGGLDKPWYRVRTDRFVASFLPSAGEEAAGRYFWCSDGLIVREVGVANITEAISGALDEGDFEQILQRLDDE